MTLEKEQKSKNGLRAAGRVTQALLGQTRLDRFWSPARPTRFTAHDAALFVLPPCEEENLNSARTRTMPSGQRRAVYMRGHAGAVCVVYKWAEQFWAVVCCRRSV